MATARERAWRVVSARFETSAADLPGCPTSGVPELAIGGRSNVGKSSLLNALCRTRGLARVSRTPGRTRLLNFFAVDLQPPKGERVPFYLVDLPGYGHADVSRRTKHAFGDLVEAYLVQRRELSGLIVLIDARRGPDERDVQLLEFARQRDLRCAVVVTKVDKLGASERGLLGRRVGTELGLPTRDVIMTSSAKGIGIEDTGKRGALVRELGFMLPREPASPAESPPDVGP